MYASIPDALRALARKIGADANGRNEEEILNNIVVKLGGTPVTNHGVAGALAALTSVVDIDDMHVLTTKTVTANGTYTASDDDADGYSSVTVNVPATAIAGNVDTQHIDFTLEEGDTVTCYIVSNIVDGSYVVSFKLSTDPGDIILTTLKLTI